MPIESSMDAAGEPGALINVEPAPLGPRIAAGAIDWTILGVMSGLLSLSPLFYGGFALPLLGSLAAIIVYTILPCSLFKATLGLRIFGLEIVGLDGRAADPGEIAFRELVARGYFGVAYFSTAAIGLAGRLSGSMVLFQPTGFGLVLFFLSGFLLLLAAIGHLMILLRPDRRGFPDLVAKTMVVKRGAIPDPSLGADLDADERAAIAKRGTQRAVKFAIFAAVLLAGTVALPGLITRAGEGKEDLPDRWRLDEAERKFKRDPANNYLASELIDKLEARGDLERAQEIRKEHHAARAEQTKTQETALRASFDRDPTNWDTFETLLTLLQDQERKTDAIQLWEKYLTADKSPETRASFGVWLYQHDENARAVAELKASMEAGVNTADAHAYLGMALKELGRKDEALVALNKALELDPELEEVAAEINELEGIE